MINKKTYTIIALCVIMLMGAVVFATQNVENGVSYGMTNNFELSQIEVQGSLKNEMFKELSNDIGRITNTLYNQGSTAAASGNMGIRATSITPQTNLDYDNAFVIYGINTDNLTADYLKTKSFESLFSEDFSLNVPVLAGDGSIVSLVEMVKIQGVDSLEFSEESTEETKRQLIEYATENEGQWKLSTIGMYIPLEVVEIFSSEEKLNTLLSSTGIDGIQNIRLVTFTHNGYIEMIYFSTSDQKEYAIAYSYRADALGIENGKLYTIQELVSIIFQ